MKVNTIMPKRLRPYYRKELEDYRLHLKKGFYGSAWQHLERAHIIGQAYPWEHSYAHWKMLKFGFRIKSMREIAGQIPRLLLGGVKSFVGKIPQGNTGGSNVAPLKTLPLEEDIEEIFRKAHIY